MKEGELDGAGLGAAVGVMVDAPMREVLWVGLCCCGVSGTCPGLLLVCFVVIGMGVHVDGLMHEIGM